MPDSANVTSGARATTVGLLPDEETVTSENKTTANQKLPWNFTLAQIERKDAPNNVKGNF